MAIMLQEESRRSAADRVERVKTWQLARELREQS